MGTKKYKIAVIGGGISGLYAAYKLSQRRMPQSIALLESQPRIGGRLMTAKSMNGDNIELGAMRISTRHNEVIKLCKDLDIKLVPFNANINNSAHFFYANLESQNPIITNESASSMIGKCAARYAGLPFFEPSLTQQIFSRMLSKMNKKKIGVESLTISEWLELIATNTEKEMIISAFGYDHLALRDISFTSCISNATGHSTHENFLRPLNGMESIAEAIHQKFIESKGIYIPNFSVATILKSGSSITLISEDNRIIEASKIIFAIPPKAIKSIRNIREVIGNRLHTRLDDIGSYASSKTYFSFSNQNTYKIPFNKDGYFRTNRFARLGHWNPVPSLSLRNYRTILASYRLSSRVDTHEFSSDEDLDKKILKDIQTLLNQNIDDPFEKISYDWLASKSSVSAHYWQKNCNPQSILSEFTMLSPWVHFIGEAFCWEHGWIESAIISTQSALQRIDHSTS